MSADKKNNKLPKSGLKHSFDDSVKEKKRSRVTRACDNCRLKKVKCDGRQPCIYCTVYSFNCTYDRPSFRNKLNNLPQVQKPHDISQILGRKNFLSLKVNDNLILAQKILALLFPQLNLNLLSDESQKFDFTKLQRVVSALQTKNPLNLNIHDICEMYLNLPTPNDSPISQIDTYPAPNDLIGEEFRLLLPPKEVALQLIYTNWTKACVLFRFYHRPSLLEEVDLIYSMDPSQYTNRQQKFLPFLYSLLACGSLFSKKPKNENDFENKALENDGYEYFLEARKLLDITDVSDIPAIQTIVMMVIYLQCSARLSTCYSYIGIAMRSALKEGLHRDLSVFQVKRNLDPIEIDTRKRLFYTIYKMDIYINCLLGLPGSISDDEIDQQLPPELDDESITREGIFGTDKDGPLSSAACANYHTRVTMLLSKIVKELYPVKVQTVPKNILRVRNVHDLVTNLECELKMWLDSVPMTLRPSDPANFGDEKDVPERLRLAKYYLHFAFLNCQLSLYRPFIHYISKGSIFKNTDPRALIRGRNCIKVARLVVKLANKMIHQDLLIGTYWFSMYTIFFSTACLVYYYHAANYNDNGSNNMSVNYAGVYFDDDLNIDMIRKDIELGKKVLDNLKNMSNSSLRIYNILNKLFDMLNKKTASSSSHTKDVPFPSFDDFDNVAKSTINSFDEINDFRFERRSNEAPVDNVEKHPEDQANDSDMCNKLFNYYCPFQNMENASPGKEPENVESAVDVIGTDVVLPLSNFESYANEKRNLKKEKSPSSEPIAGLENAPLEYVPGMIDTFDTQIFGRLLPPYMMESNGNMINQDFWTKNL